jgi:DNA repair helicase Rad3
VDSYSWVNPNENGYKNTNNQNKDSSASIEYENEKDPDDEEFKKLGSGFKKKKILNEVNEDNLEFWVDILKNAVKDLTVLSKNNPNMRMNIEDLSQAMSTIYRIGNKFKSINKEGEGKGKDNQKDNYKSFPSLMQISKASDHQRDTSQKKVKVAEIDFASDFYVWVTQEKTNFKGESKLVHNFGLWCFNPGFCFNELQSLGIRCIILTSGTLSPIRSFANELQTNFDNDLEGDHVIKPEQVLIGAVNFGVDGSNFQFTYQTKGDTSLLWDLGKSIQEVASFTPDGMLVFFPSYFMMDSCYKLWEEKGILDEIEKYKGVYKEPKQSSRFKTIRNQFEDDVNEGKGALLMGVWRGKISEGLDFSDKSARWVIVVGMPFSQFKDPKIQLKMDYLNKKHEKGLSQISGRDWYNQECSRAINQAIGRAIRHINDFGCILLFDKRYGYSSAQSERSKWVRDKQRVFDSFEELKIEVNQFFEKMISLNLPTKETKLNTKYDSFDEEDDYAFKDGSAELNKNSAICKVKVVNRSNLVMGGNKSGDIRSFMTKKPLNATNRAPTKITFDR